MGPRAAFVATLGHSVWLGSSAISTSTTNAPPMADIRLKKVTRCALPSQSDDDNDEQPIRPPNFFGAYNPEELETLLEHHRTHFGEREADDDCSKSNDGPVQGLGGLHDLVMDALRDTSGDADAKSE